MVGKALEYAVVELFEKRKEPFYTRICDALSIAQEKKKKPNVKTITVGDNLSCVRIAHEGLDAAKLSEFKKFKLLGRANQSIGGFIQGNSLLNKKVDVVFCELDADQQHRRFGILGSVKSNPADFGPATFNRYYEGFPIDVGLTLSTNLHQDVARWEPDINVALAHLTMHVEPELYSWDRASQVIDTALRSSGKKDNFIARIKERFAALFVKKTAFDEWVEFIAGRLQKPPIDLIIEEIKGRLEGNFQERTQKIVTIGGGAEDHVPDLARRILEAN